MTTTEYAIFETAVGTCGIAWGEAGIVAAWLHGRTTERTRAQIRLRHPDAREAAPPPGVERAIAGITALLAGEHRDLREAHLDYRDVPEFDRRVYEVTRATPPGETTTYGAIARALGEEPMRARDVGESLARNPFAPIVPCHRVVAAGGRLGGYSAPGGADTKRRLLRIEGAAIVAEPAQASLFDLDG